ncbi:hypothetical protein QBD01_001692 [Ochrobactrum sp. 19YEA23]|uniref:hypothetical protein n=1 Tax=Ochrobactrum sp. 19YEA23 TaxID=3039854 RepID=UPI0024793D12|nr:hypothetical protein [Ochrobactrum sp. 19YEA23]
MLKNLSIAASSVLLFGGLMNVALAASVGAGNPYPVSNYVCEDGTKLAVRLMGEHASVVVNGKPAIDLAAMGDKGTTFSNGRQTLTIIQGQLSWGVGRAKASACSGG